MEFEHFRLMIDLREFYLKYQELKSVYNSPVFSRDVVKKMLPQFEQLIKQSKKLDKRFYNLNKEFLYKSEIEQQNEFRMMDLLNIYKRVVRISK